MATAEKKQRQQQSVSDGIDGALEALEQKNGRDPNYVYDPRTETATDEATGDVYGVATWNPDEVPPMLRNAANRGKVHLALVSRADGTIEVLHDSKNRPIVRKNAKDVSALLSALRLAHVIN